MIRFEVTIDSPNNCSSFTANCDNADGSASRVRSGHVQFEMDATRTKMTAKKGVGGREKEERRMGLKRESRLIRN